MNFYRLAGILKIPVETLFEKYQELFPTCKIYDYTCGLTKEEIELLTKCFK
jgi:hypothetical protein